jgi:1,4-alpha-glucan branching enzyme
MDKLDKRRRQDLESQMADEVVNAKKGKSEISLNKVISSGVEVLDKVPPPYITGRSAKHTRQRGEEEKTAPIEFSLFAPYIKRAAIQGDFTEWKEKELEKGDDGYFRSTFELADGNYEYKFWVESNSPWQLGQWVCITDPMATNVNEMNNDNSIVRVLNGKIIIDQYEWRHYMDPLPADVELVIYELHVRDFGGNFKGVVDRLDYLSSLGVNAVELMPVSEFPGDTSWGYNPRHFYAVESAYGETPDLKNLIDECHGRGIRVIMDLVANHGQDETPLAQIDHNYWFKDNNTDEYQFGPKFDYNHWDDNFKLFPARKFMNEVAFYWATEFHLDGIRFDATALIDNFDFLHWLGDAVKQANSMKPFYLVAEHLPIDPAIVGFGKPMDGLWHDYFYWQMTANMRESEFSGWQPFNWDKTYDAIEPAREGIIGPTAAVNYISNHDHNRLMFELGTANITGEKAFRKCKLAAAITMTAVGVPMVWMGEEFGEFWDKSIEPRPLHWELLENQANSDLFHYYSGLIFLRKTNNSLKTEHIDFFHLDPANKVLAWRRWDDGGGIVAVVANFSDNALGDYAVPNFPDGDWHEFIFDYDHKVEGGQSVDTLGPSECKIYIKK